MKSLFAILILLFVASCSNYNRVLKSDDYNEKFVEANKLYDAGKFDRCVALYEQVYQRSPKSAEGEVSYYRLGKSCYAIEDWYLASYYLSTFQTKFPYSNKVEETMFLTALCAVQNSPEASLDQNETEVALDDLQNFVNRFPFSERIDTCNKVIDQLRFKLETKEILNVRLYSKTENYRAATVTAKQFIENYPISQFREEAYVMLIRNQYFLAANSIETKLEERISDTYESYGKFVVEFPNSSYLREFEIYIKKLKEIDIPVIKE